MNQSLWSLPAVQAVTVDTLLETKFENGYLFHQPKFFYSFVVDHAQQILDFAINCDIYQDNQTLDTKDNISLDEKKSRNAFLLLSNSPKNVMDELLEDDKFLLKATNVLTQSSMNSSYAVSKELASRIAALFINIINKTKDKNIIIDSVGYLTQMLQYIEDPVIFDLFHMMVTPNEDFKEMQELLSDVNLNEFILEELNSEKQNDPDIIFEKTINLCTLIYDCLKNPIIQKSFQKESILDKIIFLLENNKLSSSRSFGDAQIRLINCLWEAASLLSCKSLISKMAQLISLAIEIIKNFSESISSLRIPELQEIDANAHLIVRKYHCCIFDFMAKIAIIQPSMIGLNERNILIEAIIRIINVFPNSTNLVTSAFRVVKASMLCSDFAQKMIDSLMPRMIYISRSVTRTAAAAASLHFFADMDRTKDFSAMINGFLTTSSQYMTFYNTYFKKYLEDAYVPYGGPVAKYVQDEIRKAKKEKEKMLKKALKKSKSQNKGKIPPNQQEIENALY